MQALSVENVTRDEIYKMITLKFQWEAYGL